MVVPDTELICEMILVAEGFRGAKLLSRMFTSLYTLCKELLSEQVGEKHFSSTVIFHNVGLEQNITNKSFQLHVRSSVVHETI